MRNFGILPATDADMIADIELSYVRSYTDAIDNAVDTVANVKSELNRKLALSRKYGADEYADEIVRLLEKMDALRRASRA